MNMSFLGLMRCGEVTPKTMRADNAILRIRSVTFTSLHDQDYMPVKLEVSKTDAFRRTVTVHIGRTGHAACAYDAVKHLLSLRADATHNDYLFIWSAGRLVMYNDFLKVIKELVIAAGIPYPESYSGHSFRAGGATALANAGVPGHRIKLLRRWLSDAYQLYIRTPASALAECARLMTAVAKL